MPNALEHGEEDMDEEDKDDIHEEEGMASQVDTSCLDKARLEQVGKL